MGSLGYPMKEHWKNGGAIRKFYHLSDITKPPFRRFLPPRQPSLAQYDKIVSFGDSLMEQFVMPKQEPIHFHRSNISFDKNVWRPFNNGTVHALLDLLDEWHGQELNATQNIALLVGSAPWDLLYDTDTRDEDSWRASHREAIKHFVETVRERYAHVQLLWKSPTSLHPFRVRRNCYGRKDCRHVTRYLSRSR